MALNIGELFGTIGLDASNWDRELSQAQGNLSKFGIAGATIAATAAVAIGAALSKGIAESINVEAGNDKIQAQLGLTEEQAAVQGKAAGALFASNYGESMKDVQSSVGVVMSSIKGMRDASDTEVAAMTAKMMTLATVMEVDIARASQVAGQMITSGIAVDGTHAADLLADSLQKVPAALREDILDAVDEYGPFMSQLGIKGEEAMGILVNASEKGMYGIDKVGDALKEFTIRSTDMSKATGEAYDALGMNQEQMSADLLAGGEVGEAAFAKIIGGLQEMDDPVAQSAAALALFGTPLEDLSVNEIPQFLGQIDPMGDAFDSVAGAADKMGQDLASNAASGFGSFKRQAQAALVDFVQVNIMPSVSQLATFLSTTVGPAITELGGWITTNLMPALQSFGGWFSENQGTIAVVAGIIGTLLIPVFIRLAVQAAITAAATVAAWVMMVAGAVGAGISYAVQSAIVVASWVLMGAQALLAGARMAAAWLLAMGPIGLVIALVVGLVALIIANWDTVKAGTVAAFNAVVSFIASIPGRIMAGLAALGQLAGKMAEWVGGMYTSAVTKFGEIVSYVSGIPGKILSSLGDMGSLLLDAGGQILQGFLDGLKAGFENVKDFVGGIGSWIADNKGPKAYDLALLVPAGGWIMDGLDKGLQSKMGMLKGTLGDVSSVIASGIQPELAVTGSYTGSGAGALGSASSTMTAPAAPITMKVYITEADNADATAQRVWSKVQFKMQEAGVRIGS
ncbi:phage tail tape measure protein [Arthrobacter citreus]|uniref:phage tail tape measure protein n=1 Tax=Arthrobacter TaxID=1663 RepID=UPI0012645268|nr:phage tail tape measure protein [Arthrobacter gandavensis]